MNWGDTNLVPGQGSKTSNKRAYNMCLRWCDGRVSSLVTSKFLRLKWDFFWRGTSHDDPWRPWYNEQLGLFKMRTGESPCNYSPVYKALSSWPLCCYSDLIHCTNEMNVNIPQLADSLFERTTNTSWVVVFKSLITTQHLMVYGNEVSPVNTTSIYCPIFTACCI